MRSLLTSLPCLTDYQVLSAMKRIQEQAGKSSQVGVRVCAACRACVLRAARACCVCACVLRVRAACACCVCACVLRVRVRAARARACCVWECVLHVRMLCVVCMCMCAHVHVSVCTCVHV
jgi:hypothetical protein